MAQGKPKQVLELFSLTWFEVLVLVLVLWCAMDAKMNRTESNRVFSVNWYRCDWVFLAPKSFNSEKQASTRAQAASSDRAWRRRALRVISWSTWTQLIFTSWSPTLSVRTKRHLWGSVQCRVVHDSRLKKQRGMYSTWISAWKKREVVLQVQLFKTQADRDPTHKTLHTPSLPHSLRHSLPHTHAILTWKRLLWHPAANH